MSDPRTVRMVALLIGLTALASVIGTIILLVQDKPADAALAGLAGTALGYLAGVLTPATGSTPQAVTVVNRTDEAIPVEDAGHADTAALALVAVVALALLIVLL